jgi:ankyrin repeat protein
MVNFLLDKGADKTVQNKDGMTAVQIADRHKKMDVVNALAHHAGPVITV